MAEPVEAIGQAANDRNDILEVDSQATENDSLYGSELSNYMASLTSSVVNYRQENGRRYHGYRDGNYLLPNDEQESERLDMIHHMLLTAMEGKLFLAPISSGVKRVIDLGTGTGIWAIDFGEKYPSAEVIGNDLSPTQPSLVPPNVRFIVEDFEEEWVYQPNYFDFIHVSVTSESLREESLDPGICSLTRLLTSFHVFKTPCAWRMG
uniref:UMTA protein n=1 Tax=Coccidioides posadasii RMSCC 3488 TaxID=454284 RepID=A0A0J6F1G8_COCPO|nr:UMTA protein [Coccidioides posadasii RMSCC 3488]